MALVENSSNFIGLASPDGIGLYMVKKIVENTGGRIEVSSQGSAPPSLSTSKAETGC